MARQLRFDCRLIPTAQTGDNDPKANMVIKLRGPVTPTRRFSIERAIKVHAVNGVDKLQSAGINLSEGEFGCFAEPQSHGGRISFQLETTFDCSQGDFDFQSNGPCDFDNRGVF